MGTTTSNYGYYKPTSGEKGWASLVNANWDDIDSQLFAGDHGDLSGSGLFNLSGTASIALASSPSNWNPTELQSNTVGWITADAARDVHGLVPGSSPDGRIKMLWNVGAFDITLKDDSGTATAANRFRLPNGDVILSQDQGLMIAYDDTAHRWRPIGGVSSGGGGGGGAPDTAAYLIAATSGVSGLSAEVLAGATPGGELAGAGTSWADPAVSSIHGPEALAHHDETHPFDDDAIHTNWTAEVPQPTGLTAAAGTTGANYGNHVHRGAVDLVSLDDTEGPFTADAAADHTILSYTLAAGKAVAKMRFHFTWAGIFTPDGSTRQVSMKIKVGGTTFLTVTMSIVTGNTDAPFTGDADLIFRTIGASAKIIASGRMNGSDGGGTNWSPVSRSVTGTEATKDSTGSLAIVLTSANSNAAASHSIELATISVEGVGA